MRNALRPRGVLYYQTFVRAKVAEIGPSNPDYLLEPGELLEAVGEQLGVVAYEHGVIKAPRPAVVQRICAVRRDGAQPID